MIVIGFRTPQLQSPIFHKDSIRVFPIDNQSLTSSSEDEDPAESREVDKFVDAQDAQGTTAKAEEVIDIEKTFVQVETRDEHSSDECDYKK